MNKSNFYLHRIYHKWQLNFHQHLLIYADKYFEIKIKHRIHLNISYLCLENHPIIKKSGPFQLVYIRINYKGFLYEHGEPLLETGKPGVYYDTCRLLPISIHLVTL